LHRKQYTMEDQYRIKLSDTIDMVVTYYFDRGDDGTYDTPPDPMTFLILHVSLWQKNRDSYDHIQITDVDDHWLAWNEKAIETEILKQYGI
jgi:hypothetical protein